ncbi:MAG: hypothetical protein J0I77_17835 [Rudaea sp.]|uniref:hypothetical protein n=1 Tax=unclassified Rudaea TaxID=2627037 RepID=UPI0010F97EE3|nr:MULTISPECIES: hypothetical protein [unclassified Rudaea]MBN8887590.1 hypothetical protein [Rudaea sp.]
MKIGLIALLLLVQSNHLFAVTYSSMEHVRVGNRVVSAGDRVSQFRDAADPEKVIPRYNEYGVKIGEQWQYNRGNGSWTLINVNLNGIVTGVLDMIDR